MLLRHPQPRNESGRVHAITPQDAGWSYVGFDVFDLRPQQFVECETGDWESCLVLVAGQAAVQAGAEDFGRIGERMSPFQGRPWSVYVPPRTRWRVAAQTGCELAVCSAPAQGHRKVRLIPPAEVGEETRGTGTNTRHVRNILSDTSDVPETLLVVEVITPGGNWSSYPPHKHDTDDFPNETYLEETYYHRLARGSGFALQRIYTDDGTLDETFAVRDRDVVLVPRGYHPVGAPHGFDLYYLNVMAGPVRAWKFSMSPEHAFLGWTATPQEKSR